MSDKGFDRTIFNRLEQPSSGDWNQAQSQLDRALRDYIDCVYASRTSSYVDTTLARSGFIGNSLKVVPTGGGADLNVHVTAGLGFQVVAVDAGADTSIGGLTGLSDLTEYKPIPLSSSETIAIHQPVPTAGNERYDIIEARSDRRAENSQLVNIYNSSSKVYVPTSKAKTLAWDLATRSGAVLSPADSTTGIGYKYGASAAVGSATVPSTTAGYELLAVIYVGPLASSIDASVIRDERKLLAPAGTFTVSGTVAMTKSGGVIAAALANIIAPPGVRVAVQAGTGAPVELKFFVIAGGAQMIGTPSLYLAPPSSTKVLIPKVASVGAHTITSTDVTNLGNAAISAPATVVAKSQTSFLVDYDFVEVLDTGTVQAANMSNGDTFLGYFSLQLQRDGA